MARLPNGDRAFVSPQKIAGYALNAEHAHGGHKARVFRAALGMTAADAGKLQAALLAAALERDCLLVRRDEFGSHYTLEFPFGNAGRTATIRSLWTIRPTEDFPRLVSVYVL
mgnify:CR=1 FL=1